MSEYQYYEFQAIDRPLTREEQEAVARLSSRVDPHPRRAVFVYHWSDFRGDAEKVLTRYYDAMLYVASWGTTQLMFRFPKPPMDLEQAEAYCRPLYVPEYLSFETVGEHVVLNIRFWEEGGYRQIAGEGWLDALLPLRDDILRGDYRSLYLSWLKTLETEDVRDDVLEPPVPPGLRTLTPTLETLIEFLQVDETVVHAAAAASSTVREQDDGWMRDAIARLPEEERTVYLLRLAGGEPYLSVALRRRLGELAGRPAGVLPVGGERRTVGHLLAEAQRRRAQDQQRRAEEAERKRIRELEALAAQEPELWAEIDALIGRKTGPAYDRVVELALGLREVARYRAQEAAFGECLQQIRVLYRRRPGLIRRLNEAGL